MNAQRQFRTRQGGAVLILFVIALGTLIGMAGLALDMGHAFAVKTRLQNALDAAALSGAKTLKATASNAAQAEADAREALAHFLDGDLAGIDATTVVEFSDTLVPFVPGGTNPAYVRVRTPSVPMRIWLTSVLPGVADSMDIGGSAVAGPLGGLVVDEEVCNLVPIAVASGASPDTDCGDGNCYGYELNERVELKFGSGGSGGGKKKDDGAVAGPGNFGLLELTCGSGADCVRQELAGSFAGCASIGEVLPTEPGNNVGPSAQGINTRFGQYKGPVSPVDYPPDVVTTAGLTYAEYLARLNAGAFDNSPPTGVPKRRVVAIVFADFSESGGGRTDVKVTGIGCFFISDPLAQHGHQTLVGEFVLDCNPQGPVQPENPGPSAGGFFKIVLYKDPDSRGS